MIALPAASRRGGRMGRSSSRCPNPAETAYGIQVEKGEAPAAGAAVRSRFLNGTTGQPGLKAGGAWFQQRIIIDRPAWSGLCVCWRRLGHVLESGFGKAMGDAFDKEEGAVRDGPSYGIPRHTRRLSDKVLVAFHHACDTSDLEVAEQLLATLEMMLSRRTPNPDSNRRRSIESLVAAHERLWHLRHPDTEN